MTRKSLPLGDISEGTFDLINGTDKANGTLDFLAQCVDNYRLNLSSPENFKVDGTKLTYKFNETVLKCDGLTDKCINFVFPFVYSDSDEKLYGDLDVMH